MLLSRLQSYNKRGSNQHCKVEKFWQNLERISDHLEIYWVPFEFIAGNFTLDIVLFDFIRVNELNFVMNIIFLNSDIKSFFFTALIFPTKAFTHFLQKTQAHLTTDTRNINWFKWDACIENWELVLWHGYSWKPCLCTVGENCGVGLTTYVAMVEIILHLFIELFMAPACPLCIVL